MFKLFVVLLVFISKIDAYNICVVGGSSGLGRELIYQGISDPNLNIITLTNNPNKVCKPYRGGGLKLNDKGSEIIKSYQLTKDKYTNYFKYDVENIIFTTGSKPFEYDYSDTITKQMLTFNYTNLKNIILISAEGVGNSLSESNLGIKIMNNWYLKDVYRSKNNQEQIIKDYCNINPQTQSIILRPKVLSYGKNLYNAKSRQQFANEILNLIK